jgi:hypothetical protein
LAKSLFIPFFTNFMISLWLIAPTEFGAIEDVPFRWSTGEERDRLALELLAADSTAADSLASSALKLVASGLD